MGAGGRCSDCGAAIPGASPGGYCGQCLLRPGLERTLAVGTLEGSVKLWNLATRHQMASLEAGLSYVHSLEFAPDGSALVSGTFDKKVRVWQSPSWAEIHQAQDRPRSNR